MALDQEFEHDLKAHDLAVEFSLPSAGWIHCLIRPTHELFAISCTYICDPFRGFIAWLEAIASGSYSATWLVDQEGSTRPWPAMISPSFETRTGFVNPNRSIERAICLICFLEWMRALRA